MAPSRGAAPVPWGRAPTSRGFACSAPRRRHRLDAGRGAAGGGSVRPGPRQADHDHRRQSVDDARYPRQYSPRRRLRSGRDPVRRPRSARSASTRRSCPSPRLAAAPRGRSGAVLPPNQARRSPCRRPLGPRSACHRLVTGPRRSAQGPPAPRPRPPVSSRRGEIGGEASSRLRSDESRFPGSLNLKFENWKIWNWGPTWSGSQGQAKRSGTPGSRGTGRWDPRGSHQRSRTGIRATDGEGYMHPCWRVAPAGHGA